MDGHALTLPVPEKSCYVYALRPYLGRPQLLGTTGHFSCGVLEVENVKWNSRHLRLTGKAKGNAGDPTELAIYVPKLMGCTEVYVNYVKQQPQLTRQGVLMVKVPAVKGPPVPFEVRFNGTVEQPKMRKSLAGPVAKIK